MSMTNFNYGQALDYSKSQSKSHFKDREGVDFEPQILSQQRFHTKFHTEKDVSGDEKFDIRRYFPKNHMREFHLDETEAYAKELKETDTTHEKGEHEGGSYRGYRGRRGRGGRGGRHDYREYEEKQMYIPKELLHQQEVTLENCNMSNYTKLAM